VIRPGSPVPHDAHVAHVGVDGVWAGADSQPGQAFLPPPRGHRPSGTGPFWPAGQHVLWSYRRPHGSGGTRPVRVVADDADGLVVWLAPGTPVTVAALPDGRPVRSVGTDRVFREGRSLRTASWSGLGLLMIAPTGTPWSLWRFTAPDDRPSWYVNLEDPHCRDEVGVLTQDHVLDLVVEPGGRVLTKDADELEAAVQAGRFTAHDAARITADAAAATAEVAAGRSPFDGSWDAWTADPAWPLPVLPPALAGLPPVVRDSDPDASTHLQRLLDSLPDPRPRPGPRP